MEYNVKILNHYVVHLKLKQYSKSTILHLKKDKKEIESQNESKWKKVLKITSLN